MHDDLTFEARLADALGRYAELAPSMDDDAVAREAIAAGRSRPGPPPSAVAPSAGRPAPVRVDRRRGSPTC